MSKKKQNKKKKNIGKMIVAWIMLIAMIASVLSMAIAVLAS